MTKNKYYTPEIEEFHVGFEYQYSQYRNCIWKNEIFAEGRSISYNGEIDSEEIRVKYLDIKDIEDILNEVKEKTGKKWKYGRQSVDGYNPRNPNQEFILEPYQAIIINPNIQRIEIKKDFNNGVGIHTIFNGTIKNKSELKKLLQQLEIL